MPEVEPNNSAAAGSEKPARSETEAAEPLFSVVKGQPTDVELAVLTAVVLSLGNASPGGEAKPSVRHWVRRQQLRLAPTPGPGAWKRSKG